MIYNKFLALLLSALLYFPPDVLDVATRGREEGERKERKGRGEGNNREEEAWGGGEKDWKGIGEYRKGRETRGRKRWGRRGDGVEGERGRKGGRHGEL